jgi:multidrug efflux pump subunit AcrA (membrane-fusion protein)
VGHLEYREPGVDPSTGTVLRRGTFTNADGELLPGLHVEIQAQIGKPAPKLLVEERAIAAEDQRGEYLLVVDEKNVVEYRPVELGQAIGRMRVIEDGLSGGEHVIVNGLQRARPGAQVAPELVAMDASTPDALSQADHPPNTSAASE